MRQGVLRLLFVSVFVLNCLLWSQSRYALGPAKGAVSSYLRRRNSGEIQGLKALQYVNGTLHTQGDEVRRQSTASVRRSSARVQCRPRALPLEQQCTNVHDECPEPHTVLSVPYANKFFCSDPSVRPVLFAGYLVWLLFLFSTLGISASDFFCPNLGTLSHLLGLDENVAGVTFLAFGNGSPDLFSTFSAMREASGGLAIGELLGAAAFVTSCVVGSMCIIKPFRVDRTPFLRDVGFFTLAVIFLLYILWDSKIGMWEAESLIALYLVYVLVVVIGSWWESRRSKRQQREELMRDEYREDFTADGSFYQEPYRDDRK